MKKRAVFCAAAITVMLAGCSVKSPVSETVTEPESTTVREMPSVPEETQKETTEAPTIEAFPKEVENPATKPPAPEFLEGCRLLLASDIHYLSKSLTDFGDGFSYKVEHGDGKVVNYIWEITDAFIEAVEKEKPDLVILSGDLTLNGERQSHLDFAEKLEEIEDAGIPVIVIPGNHDINNTAAVQFVGAQALGTAHILSLIHI